jgi:ribonuclease D
MHWAQEEFERAEGTQWDPSGNMDAFMRVKGARDLSRRELARLRELVAWRDEIAAEVDRATFRVAGNEVLLEMSRRAPKTREDMTAIRGFPRSMSDARIAEAIAGIERANALPDSELPRFPKSARWDRDPEFDDRVSRLKAVRDEAADRLELDPGVLCSRDRMEAVARRNPQSIEELSEMTELRRWQVEVLGEGFVRALARKSAGDSAASTTRVRSNKGSNSSDSPYSDG